MIFCLCEDSSPYIFVSLLKTVSVVKTGERERVAAASFRENAEDPFQFDFDGRPLVASEKVIRNVVIEAACELKHLGFSDWFYVSEWSNVIGACGVSSTEEYMNIERTSRKSRLGLKQRQKLWPLFEGVRDKLNRSNYLTWTDVFTKLACHLSEKTNKPVNHVILDEAQDLGTAELRFFAAIAPETTNALFFTGDLGQRIFQHPYSWKSLGVDMRGRSSTLKVCYRISQQICIAADRLLPLRLRDVDGLKDERSGTVSTFEGPAPEIGIFAEEAKKGMR